MMVGAHSDIFCIARICMPSSLNVFCPCMRQSERPLLFRISVFGRIRFYALAFSFLVFRSCFPRAAQLFPQDRAAFSGPFGWGVRHHENDAPKARGSLYLGISNFCVQACPSSPRRTRSAWRITYAPRTSFPSIRGPVSAAPIFAIFAVADALLLFCALRSLHRLLGPLSFIRKAVIGASLAGAVAL